MAILNFQKPDKVIMIDSTESHGKFEFRPLEPGYGLTIGNALRRVLLSSLEGYAFTSVKIDGVDVLAMQKQELHDARRHMQMVFQDPFASLDPQMRLIDQVAEPMQNYKTLSEDEIKQRVEMLFDRVKLPRSFLRRYPHELSGGQRQRIAIARALALNPELIIADEAVSALDVSVQAEVLNLLQRLKKERGLTYILVSHNLSVVGHMCDDLAVMNHGMVVEELAVAQLKRREPRHPYTRQLMVASLGYDRAAVDKFEDFGAEG